MTLDVGFESLQPSIDAPPQLSLLSDRQEARPAAKGRQALKFSLVALDFVGSFGAWLLILTLTRHRTQELLLSAVALGSLNVAMIAAHRLYLARVCAVRSVEVGRLATAALICALAATCFNQIQQSGPSPTAAIIGAATAFAGLALLRAGYTACLRAYRSRGVFCRPLCILGDTDEAAFLVDLIDSEPEMGYRVVSVVGDPSTWAARATSVPAIAAKGDPVAAVLESGVSSVLVATSGLDQRDVDRMVRRLLAGGLHVQISTSTTRIGHQRMRANPLSHHLLFYVERSGLSSWQQSTKRILDILVAATALVLASPVIAVAAIAIKLEDRGPVFYRQERVGRLNHTFEVFKLRTMVPDASARLAELVSKNERSGPLFKLSFDPRVTRVGRFLRASSIDELPQLFNVLRGEMSLVGPRPALPKEVAQFDDDLIERAAVLPGITGLWQVEARDNPSFSAYRRLDLFYVDNWSVILDLTILFETALVVIVRGFRALFRRGEMAAAIPTRGRLESLPTLDIASGAIGEPAR